MNIIRTIVFSTALAAVGLVGFSAQAASDRQFTVVNNNNSQSIQQVWKAPAGTSQNYDEVYLDSPITPNTRSEFDFENSGPTCLFDVRVQFADGVAQEFANVNVCRGDRVLAD
jgi:hypothetical protein